MKIKNYKCNCGHDGMTTLKDYYGGDLPCNDCVHKRVCNVQHCFEETKIETTHPFVDIQVKCSEYIYYNVNVIGVHVK